MTGLRLSDVAKFLFSLPSAERPFENDFHILINNQSGADYVWPGICSKYLMLPVIVVFQIISTCVK
jgi:hypothetical protein